MASESKDAMDTELADSRPGAATAPAQPQAEAPGAINMKGAFIILLARCYLRCGERPRHLRLHIHIQVDLRYQLQVEAGSDAEPEVQLHAIQRHTHPSGVADSPRLLREMLAAPPLAQARHTLTPLLLSWRPPLTILVGPL